jgi:organic radical activating enzyme
MFNCDSSGQDMTYDVFVRTLKLFEPYLRHEDGYRRMTLGGGEPSIHPELELFVSTALDYGVVGIKTNGTRYDRLSKLKHRIKRSHGVEAAKNNLLIAVSYDDYHDSKRQDSRFLCDRRFQQSRHY